MTEEEFLSGLRSALSVAGSAGLTEQNEEYYRSYIHSEMQKGRSVEEIMEELGDPRLIARSILDAEGYENVDGVYTRTDEETNKRNSEKVSSESTEKFENFFRPHVFLIPLAALILIVVLVVLIIGSIFSILSPIIFPLLLVWFVVLLIRNLRR